MDPIPQLLEELGTPHEADAPLGPLTWYGVGGAAKALAHPHDEAMLAALMLRCHEASVPVYILGGGANLLVRDCGVDGVVLRLDAPAFTCLHVADDRLTVGAGHDLAKLVMEAARAGLSGIECLAGIPGTAGGAVRMNAGGAYGAIGPRVAQVRVMDRRGDVTRLEREQLRFDYRRSSIDAPIILDVTLQLERGDPQAVRQRVKTIFAHKKASQPLADASAGCVFKNPQSLPDSLPADTPRAAGALIDLAGLKGLRVGGAEVSSRHANFVVAHDGCRADDIVALIERMQSAVAARFGVTLERELVIWPDDAGAGC